MKKMIRALALLCLLTLAAAACGSDGPDGSIEVEDARYRLARADLGAGYMNITNGTGDAVTLRAVSAEGVGRIELHESSMGDDGTMAMQARPEGFTIEAGETISLEPGGLHLMFFDPTTDGSDLALSLDFGTETIEIQADFDKDASASIDTDDNMDDMEMEDDEMESMDES